MATSTPPSVAGHSSQNTIQTTVFNNTTQPSNPLSPSINLAPSNIDVLPLVTSLLLRLQSSNPTQSQSSTITTGATPQVANTPSTSALAGSTIDKSLFSTAPLTTKEIPLAADELKQRLRKARTEIGKLEDLTRTVEEQEDEIRELEARIAEQRAAVEQLSLVGRKASEHLKGSNWKKVDVGEEMDVS